MTHDRFCDCPPCREDASTGAELGRSFGIAALAGMAAGVMLTLAFAGPAHPGEYRPTQPDLARCRMLGTCTVEVETCREVPAHVASAATLIATGGEAYSVPKGGKPDPVRVCEVAVYRVTGRPQGDGDQPGNPGGPDTPDTPGGGEECK